MAPTAQVPVEQRRKRAFRYGSHLQVARKVVAPLHLGHRIVAGHQVVPPTVSAEIFCVARDENNVIIISLRIMLRDGTI